MSIFPKHVSKNENVIIHLKFTNRSKKTSLFCYHTQIINPKGEIVKEWNDKFIMSPEIDESMNKKEIFVQISGDFLKVPGKYLARTRLFVNGRVINSITEKNDFFYVDEVLFKKILTKYDKATYELINLSINSNVKVSLIKYDGTIVKDIELEPNECYRYIGDNNLQLRYENHSIQQVCVIDRYMKNPKYDYRVVENRLELFDDSKLEAIVIPNKLAHLWINCDGLLTVDNLAELQREEIKEVEKMLDFLIYKKLLVKIKI